MSLFVFYTIERNDRMIINVGQRTDIPAFYSEWFFQRIKEGFVYVRNPYYPSQIIKYLLEPSVVDCLCFCTKNPAPMLPRLNEIDQFKQFWFVTITPYDRDIEPHVPLVKDVMRSFITLSKKVGKNAIALRYDPIIVNDKYDVDYHLKAFEFIIKYLSPYTNQCVISFVDLYRKTIKNCPDIKEVEISLQHKLVKKMAQIAQKYHIELHMCHESNAFRQYGVICNGCMSVDIIERAINNKLNIQSKKIREGCECLIGSDIGEYNTCLHGCLYCYANEDRNLVIQNYHLHDSSSPLLIGHIDKDDIIKQAKQTSNISYQMFLKI